jgi:hypothetical protein
MEGPPKVTGCSATVDRFFLHVMRESWTMDVSNESYHKVPPDLSVMHDQVATTRTSLSPFHHFHSPTFG